MEEMVTLTNKEGKTIQVPRSVAMERGAQLKPRVTQEDIGWGAVGRDIMGLPAKLGESLMHAKEAFPSEFMGLGQNVAEDPLRVMRSHFGGVTKDVNAALNLPGELRDYLVKRGIVDQGSPSFRFPEEIVPRHVNEPMLRNTLNLGEPRPGDALAELMPGMVGAAPGAIKGTMALGRGIRKAGSKLGEMTPDIKGMAERLMQEYSPSSIVARNYPGPLSLEEIQANARAAEGTFTPLGEVISSPRLKQQYENKILKLPLGDANQVLGQAEKQVKNRAQDVVETLRPQAIPKNVTDYDRFTHNILKQERRASRSQKNALYNAVSQIADKEGWIPKLDSFSGIAKENWDILNDSPLYNSNTKIKNQFNEIYNYIDPTKTVKSKIISAEGVPFTHTIHPTFSQIKTLGNNLWEKGLELSNSLDAVSKATGTLYMDLAEALRNDVRSSILNSGSPQLQEAFNVAEDFYRNNYSRFLDPEIHKLIKEGKKGRGSDSLIQDIIKPGETRDPTELIAKVQDILPPKFGGLLGYGYLQKAKTKSAPGIPSKITPLRLDKKIKSLGTDQFDALYGEAARQELLDFQNLKRMNPEAMSRMTNPKTGARLNKNTYKENFINMLMKNMHTDPEFRDKVLAKIRENEGKSK